MKLHFDDLYAIVLAFLASWFAPSTLTHSYLMQHPDYMKAQMTRCQLAYQKTPEREAVCEIIEQAANDFLAAVEEQQADPELYGQRVMEAELAYVQARKEYLATRKEWELLKRQKASGEELKASEDKLKQAKDAYQQKSAEMNQLLAVIGVSSPE